MKIKHMSKTNFIRWMFYRNLPSQVVFGTSTSYLGDSIFAQPGAFFITDTEWVFWSYSRKDCFFSKADTEVTIRIPITDIEDLQVKQVCTLRRIALGGMFKALHIRTKAGNFAVLICDKLPEAAYPQLKKNFAGTIEPILIGK